MAIPADVLHGSERFQEWLLALRDRALLGSTIQAYAMIRAVLIEVRDRATVEAALRFADALPPLVRGIMLEGWHPGAERAPASASFEETVRMRLEPHTPPPDGIVDDVLWVLAVRIPRHDWTALTEHMPMELQGAWRTAMSRCP